MSDKEVKEKKIKKEKKEKKTSKLKILLIILLIAVLAVGAVALKFTLSAIKDAPKVDPTKINELLDETSTILDANGNLIEKIQTEEYRTIVSLDKVPKHLQDAYVSIEDERFESHIGVDLRGILSSVVDNLKAGKAVRGASTITQQLARNLYLSNEKKLDRKIKEAYIAIQLEQNLTKDQILETYLNRIYLGQGAYGVQEASQTYFSKNVEDLTIGEAATLAGIVKSPTKYSIYKTVKPENFDEANQIEVGRLDILGEKYIAVFNEEAVKRQKIVLNKMLELNKISKEEYDAAINEDIAAALKPGKKKINDITSYFNDLIKTDVVNSLINDLGYSKDDAESLLYGGGLKIYSTMDLNLQRKLENIYENFTQVLLEGYKTNGPAFISWKLDSNQNILDERNNIIFFKKDSILTEEGDLKFYNNSYTKDDSGVRFYKSHLVPYNEKITISNYYTIDDNKNLVTHTIGALSIPEDMYSIDNESIFIKNEFLDKNPNFLRINEEGTLLISKDYFANDEKGIVQPQSASVIVDYRNGHIKAIAGGRDVKGARILNRALTPRQPGSTIKPLAAYLPALDTGSTAASPIDDVPYMVNDEIWPNNWYKGFRGIMSLRKAVEQSVNVTSVKTVEKVGIETSLSYLEKMGIIDSKNPANDSFVSRSESAHNDENLSALGLGGMSKGISPLKLTGGFSSIANMGVYKEPVSFTKVIDSNGKVLIDNTKEGIRVAQAENAYIMTDILRTTVTEGIAGRAQIPNMTTAGKTGTTQDKADAWFAGFTPYYAMSTWIGNDNPQIKLNQGSAIAAKLWRIIMTEVHDGLENKSFERPEGIVELQVCTQSGKIPTSLCNSDPRSVVRTEIFNKANVPSDSCDVHISANVCAETGLLATEYCPVGSRSVIKRTPPYDPAAHGGVYPSDYDYTMPSSYCNVHTKSKLEEIIDNIIGNGDDEEDEGQEDGEEKPEETEKPEESPSEDKEDTDKEDNEQ